MSDFTTDFTSRDYTAIRADLLANAQTALPEWTNQSPTDFGVVLIELFAYAADIMHYYIDRVADEAFTQTARLRRSLIVLSEMFGYRPTGVAAASTTLRFSRSAGTTDPVVIPAGTQVSTQAEGTAVPVYFETDALATIPDSVASVDVTATEGRTVTDEVLGTSSGQANQSFPLYFVGAIDGAVAVNVYEGTPVYPATTPEPVEWQFVTSLTDYDANAAVFTTALDDAGVTSIVFGDGVNGRIPGVGIELRSTYRYGVGLAGNVGAGALVNIAAAITNLARVTNVTAANGGQDAESMTSLRRNIGLSLRANDRAVTLDDHESLALMVPGVAKASAVDSAGSGEAAAPLLVYVYVAPTGGGAPSVGLRAAVEEYIDARNMVRCFVTALAPTYVSVDIVATVYVLDRFVRERVETMCEVALADLLAFDNVDFGQRISIGDVYRTIMSVEGVDYVTLTTLTDIGAVEVVDIVTAEDEIPEAGSIVVTGVGGIG